MREQVVNFLNNINLGYLSLVITLFIVSFIFLHNKGINKFFMELFIIVYVLISWIGFYYLNDIFNLVFDLKYLDVKLYLILLIIGILLIIISENLISFISELFLIAGWVVIWEMVYDIIFNQLKRTKNKNHYQKLAQAQINFETKR